MLNLWHWKQLFLCVAQYYFSWQIWIINCRTADLQNNRIKMPESESLESVDKLELNIALQIYNRIFAHNFATLLWKIWRPFPFIVCKTMPDFLQLYGELRVSYLKVIFHVVVTLQHYLYNIMTWWNKKSNLSVTMVIITLIPY